FIDQFVKFIQIRFCRIEEKFLVSIFQSYFELILWPYKLCNVRIIIVRFHKFNHQRFRKIRKLIAYTDTTDNVFVLRISKCYVYNSTPQQKQRHRFLLIFLHYKRTTHFYTTTEKGM